MRFVANARLMMIALVALAVVVLVPTDSQAGPRPDASRISDAILDPTARGVVTYEATANVGSYQQDALLTYDGYQYTAWYRADGRATISRRALPRGDWDSIELDAFLFADDSHNTISMAVSADGRIHLAFATHADEVRYTRSVPGLADDPSGTEWSSTSFERTRGVLPGAPEASPTFTYPQFEMVRGRLLLTYRDGSTDNGRQVLLRYNDDPEATWSYLGAFTDSRGTYTSPYGTSTSRYGYLHGFQTNPVTGDLEISFSWREQTSAWCSPSGLGNHDLGYARSPDGGLTWFNNDGVQIGRTGTDDLISIDDPHVVVPISINRGLINQETQAADSRGRLHVVTSMFNDADLAALGGCHTQTYPQRVQYARPYHHWRDRDGTWHTVELPFYSGSAGRTKLLFDRRDTAYLVLPDARIAVATAHTRWTDWRIAFEADDVDNVAELIVDRQRIDHDRVLSVAYQETSTPRDAPSAFRVADFSLERGARDRPKATEPEAPPVPYDGSAPTYPSATASSSQPGYPPDLAVDATSSTFWVSVGTQAGEGPTPDNPETLTIEYGRVLPIGQVTVVPRTGYGPRAMVIEARVDGVWQQLADVQQSNDTQAHTVPPTSADALRLVITDSYDPFVTPSRNVQVAEVSVSPPT